MKIKLSGRSTLGSAVLLFGLGIIPVQQTIVQAVPLRYTLTGIGTGTFENQAFTNAAFKIDLAGDSTTVTNPTSGIFFSTGPATVNVTGIGTAAFTDQMEAVGNQNQTSGPGGGISDATTNFSVVSVPDAAFTTYDLKTALAPVSTNSPKFSLLTDEATDHGVLEFSSVSQATFSAAVPEPSLAILAVGCGLFLRTNRRVARSRKAVVI